jgi:DNA-directed RNA polymerase specialized sigma24 family protein
MQVGYIGPRNQPVAYDPDTALGGAHQGFPTTRRSLIRSAAGTGGPARDALDAIIAVYWKPAYKHVRIQWRRSNDEAKDLVQGFFAALLEQEILANFDASKARFRTYLKSCLDRFVMKQDESARRVKRGGAASFVFDFEAAERELAGSPSPEDIFFHEWQREMFALALQDLKQHCQAAGKQVQYRIFEQYDLAEAERPGYAALAAEHSIPVTAVTNYLAWVRRELRRLLLARLSAITAGEDECHAELRDLFAK